MPVEHYENFPVASLLLPARLRRPVEAIYRFARTADDVADEGDASPQERKAELARLLADLDRIEAREAPLLPICTPLAVAVRDFGLPLQPLRDLLDAFSQDVVQTRYTDFTQLMHYCERSANPVGRLLLVLYRATSQDDQRQSDAICSSLQLINFLQDVDVDAAKGRIYLPQADLAAYGVSENQIAAGRVNGAWRLLMSFQVNRARELMLTGAPLARRLPGRIGLELRLIVCGGLHILDQIEGAGYDVFRHRPELGLRDWALLTWRAFARYPAPHTASR